MLDTERLLLRRWTDADRAPFAAMNDDPEVMEFFPARLTRAEADALVDRIERDFETEGFGLWAVERRDTGEFIGFTGLSRVRHDIPVRGEVEVGWRLARAAWGQGFASEAARASLDHGFGTAGLDAIMSMTAVVNVRSRAVMERIGMRYDPASDFEHTSVAVGHVLRPHVVYRIGPALMGTYAGGEES
jgi:ribosomal-protein-alanine N-acetyltransferase